MADRERRAAAAATVSHAQEEGAGVAHRHGASCRHGCAASGSEKGPVDFDAMALVSARGLAVTRNGRDLLVDVSLDIRDGEILTLIGPNGAGKTTLVRVLLGLERPDRGEARRRRGLRIGYVPQRFDVDAVIPMTVERFLMLGNDAPQRVAAMLSKVDAASTRHQQMSELSGGELQRVILARALLRDPNLLVLDEPVQGVDYTGEADLYNLIARLRDENRFGVLLVSHDLHIVMAKSDRVICLNRHVCCSGVPEAVAQHPSYLRLFGADARAFAVYRHRHDHSHDITGEPHPATPAPADIMPGADERA
jgi:zinc transport system ATP-binding protein